MTTVEELIAAGCRIVSLGIVQMPQGYTLLINPDCTHYFWVDKEGRESADHWRKWKVYQWARIDAAEHSVRGVPDGSPC